MASVHHNQKDITAKLVDDNSHENFDEIEEFERSKRYYYCKDQLDIYKQRKDWTPKVIYLINSIYFLIIYVNNVFFILYLCCIYKGETDLRMQLQLYLKNKTPIIL